MSFGFGLRSLATDLSAVGIARIFNLPECAPWASDGGRALVLGRSGQSPTDSDRTTYDGWSSPEPPPFGCPTDLSDGAKVIKRHDAAITPHQRTLAWAALTVKDRRCMTKIFAAIHPAELGPRHRHPQRPTRKLGSRESPRPDQPLTKSTAPSLTTRQGDSS
jgi:hypothetical protein